MQQPHWFVLLWIAFLAALTPGHSVRADDTSDEAAFKKRAAAVEGRERRIAAELAKLNVEQLPADDWAKEFAGTYYTGDGLGVNIRFNLAPKSGIAYTWRGCLGLYEANHGEIVDASPEALTIKWALDPDKENLRFLSSKMYFVRWGSRRYLVPERQMRELAINYNRGGFYRQHLMGIARRFDDLDKVHARDADEPAGRPQLPPAYAKMIIDKPRRLTITKFENVKEQRGTEVDLLHLTADVELSAGTNDGLFVGMEFDCDPDQHETGSIELTHVDKSTCRGTFSATLYGQSDRPPKVDSRIILPGATPEASTPAKKKTGH